MDEIRENEKQKEDSSGWENIKVEEDKVERKCEIEKKKKKVKGRVGYVSMQGNLQNENYNCVRTQQIITKVSK